MRFFEAFPMFRLYSSTLQVIRYKKKVEIKQQFFWNSFIKISSFLSYVFPVLEFLNFLAIRELSFFKQFLIKTYVCVFTAVYVTASFFPMAYSTKTVCVMKGPRSDFNETNYSKIKNMPKRSATSF